MKTLSLLALALPLLSAAASAAPHGIYWTQSEREVRAKSRPQSEAGKGSGDLLYYGGPVIANAKVYAVFWGDNVSATTKAKIGPALENMVDSGYIDWLSQYDTNLKAVDGREGTKQHIGRGTFGGNFTIQPANRSQSLTDADVQAELEAQIKAGKLPPADENTLYMTYYPSGVSISIEGMKSCQQFCAYHEGFMSKTLGAPVYYGVMPVCGGFGCGFGDAFKNLSIVSSHEAFEAITDPFPTPGDKPAFPQAWNTRDGEEIADLCPSNPGTVTGHGITTAVSGEWDNKTHSCINGPWKQSAEMPAGAMVLRPLPTFKASWAAAPAW